MFGFWLLCRRIYYPQQNGYLVIGTLLVLLGLVDDKLDISAMSRLVVIATVSMSAVVALWVIAIPFTDMTLVMFRRLANGQSPLTTDRTHIHHVLLAYGFGAKVVLCVVSL